MGNRIRTVQTTLSPEDTIVRAVQFFSNQSWRPSSQTSRSVTFQGKQGIPWFMLLLTFVGFLFCILPGIILYFFVIQKMYGFVNLVITVTPIADHSEVTVSHPSSANGLVRRFTESLPPVAGAPEPVEVDEPSA